MSGDYLGDSMVKDRKIPMAGHFGEAYGLLAGIWVDREKDIAIYMSMTGQGGLVDNNYGEFSGMYLWEELFYAALLDNLFPEL